MEEPDRDSQILVLLPFAAPSQGPLSVASEKVRGLIIAIQQSGEDAGLGEQQPPTAAVCIPWHISNRYYEADVHFKLSSLNFLNPNTSSRSGRPKRLASIRAEPQDVDDEELKKRVRDVFEALERPEMALGQASKERGAEEEQRRRQLQREVEGVDAVVMVVDRAQPLKEHRRLLSMLSTVEDDRSLLSGFDLAISLVVALPIPLEEHSSASPATAPSSEELQRLYTGEGWEYVDLEERGDVYSDDDEGEGMDAEEAEDGPQGILRLREALETHTWPGLRRKDRRAKLASSNVERSAPSPLQHTVDDDEATERALAALRLDLAAVDTAGTAEPTRQDEELADAFLKRILASQTAIPMSLEQDDAVGGGKSRQSMQDELERFLESEDVGWPHSTAHTLADAAEADEEAWGPAGDQAGLPSQPAFDDDFSSFVTGAERNGQDKGLHQASFEEQSDLDEAALLRALEREDGVVDGQAGMDFESTLSAIMGQAERVRSIADPDRRREEAARVALALVQQRP